MARPRSARTKRAKAPASGAGELETAAVAPRFIAINGLIPVRDRQRLQFLSRRTRIPQSEYLREAIRDVLRKYQDAFEGSPYEDDLPL